MLSTLYISLPSKAAAAQGDWLSDALSFALMNDEGALQQQGEQRLADLKNYLHQARQVVLLLAASDVSLLRVQVPPLSAGKLRAALPNLVEEQVMGDLADLVLVASPVQGGECTVAVVDKAWLQTAATALMAMGAKRVLAYPLPQTLEHVEGKVSVMLSEAGGNALDLAVRSAEYAGFGLSLTPDSAEAAVTDVLQALQLFVPDAAMVLLVPQHLQAAYQKARESDEALATRIEIRPANWHSRVAGIATAKLDLMAGLQITNLNQTDWKSWRWPALLAGLALLVNIIGLNVEWISMKREAQHLSDSLTQSFRTAYPKETVVRAPLEQMQQKVSSSMKLAGLSTPDDFAVLTSRFSQVWDGLQSAGTVPAGSSVVSLEYREHSLFVKLKADGLLPIDAIRTALVAQSLALASSAEGVLQIKAADRSAK